MPLHTTHLPRARQQHDPIHILVPSTQASTSRRIGIKDSIHILDLAVSNGDSNGNSPTAILSWAPQKHLQCPIAAIVGCESYDYWSSTVQKQSKREPRSKGEIMMKYSRTTLSLRARHIKLRKTNYEGPHYRRCIVTEATCGVDGVEDGS